MNIQKIIFAEDDEDDRSFFKEALDEIQPVELIFAENDKELIHLLDTVCLPDLIFLGNYRYTDQYGCLTKIKGNAALNEIPVIVYSDSNYDEHVDEAYTAKANIYVTKPSSFEKIKTMLQKIIALDIKRYIPQPSREDFVLLLE